MPDRPADESSPAVRRRNVQWLPPEVMDILVPSIKVGASTGACGLFVGTIGGITRSAPVPLFALVSGVQWFTLGASYYAARRTVITAWGGDDNLTNSKRTQASFIAGACSGMAGGMLRGPKNIMPAVVVFSMLGASGQMAYNRWEARPEKAQAQPQKAGWLSKWGFFRPLSDKEYESMLQEKILRLDAEIALIDESIAALREPPDQATPPASPDTQARR